MGFLHCFLALAFLLAYCNASSLLLFSNRKDIRLIDADNRRRNFSRLLIKDLEEVNFVDFHYAEEMIYWADAGLEEIKSMHINDSKTNKSIISTGLISPDGLAVDWMGKKLYWTDSETNRIEVSNLDGSNRKVLFWNDLDQPRSLAVVPMDGWMFWTDWGETPKIEKASMDGNHTSRKVIVTEYISWPNGIAVDYDTKRIYWTDAKIRSIFSIDFNGRHRQTITKEDIPRPFALTLYQDMLYWTDWSTKALHGCNKLLGCVKRTTFGGFLTPMGIQFYSEKRQPKGPTPCDKNNGGCSHLCLLSATEPFYSCACPTGVLLKPDNPKMCQDGPQELLLLVRRTDLRRISLDTPDYTDVVLELEGIKHAIAVDYDPVDKQIYWTDDEAKAIRRAELNGTGQIDLVVTEVHHPESIAVDWIARNMYWTDTGTDRIEVARLNGTSRKILITENLDEPRAIIVDPVDGHMYWTDWGTAFPKIEKAALDGSQRVVIVNSSLGWPNGLSIDYSQRKLYWGDAKTDKIEVSNLDGSDRRELVSDQLPHIFGFSLLGDYIYWTDWQRRSIERVDKVTGINRETIIDQLPDLMGLKAINVNYVHGTNPCAVNNGNCSHLCLNRPENDFICSCPIGLELTSDNVTCIVPEAFLLFSRKDNIRRISLESNHDDTIPISGVQEANALDYDINDNRIYWTDASSRTISRAFMNGSSVEPVVEFGLNYPEGMAVDWIAQNLYWADMGLNRIEVCRLNGSSRKVLLYQNMDDPRALALDPSEGYMYWTDWGTSGRIERSAMDGSNRRLLIGKLGRPNALTIDYLEQRLYWIDVDARKIESSDLSGNQRMQVVVHNLFEPYGLTQYADHIYWTDWTTHRIVRANKTSGENRTTIQEHIDSVMDIEIYHTSRQSGWNPCAVNNGGCSHLCLALPVQHKTLSHHCDCPTHYSLTNDNRSCIYPHSFMLFSQRASISRFLVNTLDSPEVMLPIHGVKNVKALEYDPVDHFVYWIDGRAKTIKKSHVNGSKVSTVVSNTNDNIHPFDLAIDPYSRVVFWSCSQHNTINVTTIRGMPIGTVIGDEGDKPRFIVLHPAKGLLFWVNMMHPPLIERANMDGHMRKILFSTDIDRPVSLAVDTTDNYLYWGDQSSRRIERSTLAGAERTVLLTDSLLQPVSLTILDKFMYWIDHDQQIIEMANKNTGLERQRIQRRMPLLINLLAVNYNELDHYINHQCALKNGGCSHMCLMTENNKKRCACPLHLVLSTDGNTCIDIPVCAPDKFRCLTGVQCLPELWRCDGRADCDDMSDEMNCEVCKPGQFRCHNGDCIDNSLKCDGTSHCKDFSDEECCQKEMFLCPNSHECISSVLLCDSKKDCLDGADESHGSCEVLPSEIRNTNTHKDVILGVCVVVGVIAISVAVACLVRNQSFRKNTEARAEMVPSMLGNGTISPRNIGNQRDIALSSLRGSSLGMSRITPSINPSESSTMYDRNHVTGASSSSSSQTYPLETLNPPPSPVTVRSHYGHGHFSMGSYRYYRARNKPPPPTPCSTDVCDSEACGSCYYGSGIELSYECDPFIPPPPTPRSPYLSDDNYDAITFPIPPPPSPVPGST